MAKHAMRAAVLAAAIFLLGGCTKEMAVTFKDPKTGEIKAVCGPLYGMASYIEAAQKNCVDEYVEAGWVRQ